MDGFRLVSKAATNAVHEFERFVDTHTFRGVAVSVSLSYVRVSTDDQDLTG